MYVKDNMTLNPVTIGPDESVSRAMEVMSNSKLHRLPVVDSSNRLVGLLTGGVIRANTPNNSSTLSVFELNYLLNKLSVKDIMIKDVKTIGGDALLEEAATLMLKNGVDTRALQEVLGHSNLNTTQIYTHLDNSALHEAAMANPIGRKLKNEHENSD